MFYIVGLGNPGEEYKNSRHNAGWLVLETFRDRNSLPEFISSSKYAGEISEGVVADEEVVVLLPQTYMNKSGSAVKKLVPGKADVQNLIVVYDDIDLALGDIKISVGKGAGGHNGVQSVIDALGTKDFIRIRVGIAGTSFFTGKPERPKGGRAMTNRVLGSFTGSEMKKIEAAGETVHEILKTILTDGFQKAMNVHN